MDALYLLSYEGIFVPKKYNINTVFHTRVIRRLTIKVIRHVPMATVRRLFPLHERKSATASPAAAARTDPVEKRMAGKVMADKTE